MLLFTSLFCIMSYLCVVCGVIDIFEYIKLSKELREKYPIQFEKYGTENAQKLYFGQSINYGLMYFTAGRMIPCFIYHVDNLNKPIIYFGFDSNHTDLFPYIVPNCDAIEKIRNCFIEPDRMRHRKILPEIASIIARDLAELYFSGFLNICYKEEFPIINCLDYVDLGWNHQRCMHYELDESKPKRYQFFDVPYFNDSKGIDGLTINNLFDAVHANYSEFLKYIDEREKYTEQVKRENTFAEFIQMKNESDKCINDAECDFPSEIRLLSDQMKFPCECFTPIRDCLHQINTTLPNYQANDFFVSNKLGCYKQDYPIVRCLEFGEHIRISQWEGHREQIKRCVRYELDESKPKQNQTFDVPFFYDSKDPKQLIFNNVLAMKYSMRYDVRSMLTAFVKMITGVDMTLKPV